MSASCNQCGKPTNAPSGVCAICQVMDRVDEKIGGEKMAKHKECITNGCESPAQKDGLCYRCYKSKHGKAPYPGMDCKPKKKNKKDADKKEKAECPDPIGANNTPKQQTCSYRVNSLYVECGCRNWGTELHQSKITETLGAPFSWCPWCGRELRSDVMA